MARGNVSVQYFEISNVGQSVSVMKRPLPLPENSVSY